MRSPSGSATSCSMCFASACTMGTTGCSSGQPPRALGTRAVPTASEPAATLDVAYRAASRGSVRSTTAIRLRCQETRMKSGCHLPEPTFLKSASVLSVSRRASITYSIGPCYSFKPVEARDFFSNTLQSSDRASFKLTAETDLNRL